MVQVHEFGSTEGATLDQPIDHLFACHRRIEQRLDTMERAADVLDTRRDEALAAIGRVMHFLDTNGAWHTEDEEVSLFPRLRPLIDEASVGYLRDLEQQHAGVERTVAALRSALDLGDVSPIVAEARNVAAVYRAHIRFEESRLLDLARAALGSSDLEVISAEMKQRRGL